MSTHGPEYKNGGPPAYRPIDERVEILEDRTEALKDRADASDKAIEERDAKLIVVLSQLMQASQRTEATAKAGLDVATLLAEQFHAMRGTVATTREDTLAVERGLAAMQSRVATVETKQTEAAAIIAGPHSERPSFHDLDEAGRKAIEVANKDAEKLVETKFKIGMTELELRREREDKAKLEKKIEKSEDHAHGYKLVGFNRLIGASGAIIVGAAWLIWYLLVHR